MVLGSNISLSLAGAVVTQPTTSNPTSPDKPTGGTITQEQTEPPPSNDNIATIMGVIIAVLVIIIILIVAIVAIVFMR